MRIALDWDGTYTAGPVLWGQFIRAAKARRHEVHIVTMRSLTEPVMPCTDVDGIHYTDRKAKRAHMLRIGFTVDVWIDDMPEFVVHSAAPRDLAENARTGLWSPDARIVTPHGGVW